MPVSRSGPRGDTLTAGSAVEPGGDEPRAGELRRRVLPGTWTARSARPRSPRAARRERQQPVRAQIARSFSAGRARWSMSLEDGQFHRTEARPRPAAEMRRRLGLTRSGWWWRTGRTAWRHSGGPGQPARDTSWRRSGRDCGKPARPRAEADRVERHQTARSTDRCCWPRRTAGPAEEVGQMEEVPRNVKLKGSIGQPRRVRRWRRAGAQASQPARRTGSGGRCCSRWPPALKRQAPEIDMRRGGRGLELRDQRWHVVVGGNGLAEADESRVAGRVGVPRGLAGGLRPHADELGLHGR